MKKKVLLFVSVMLAVVMLVFCLAACGDNQSTSGSKTKKGNKGSTLADVGLAYERYYPITEFDDPKEYASYRPMTKVRTLEDIYFPEGIFDTGLGMYIYKNDTKNWVATNTESGKALFDNDKPTIFSIHGMGGNANADKPDLYYQAGYNVVCFRWGCYADEDNANVFTIVNKVWLSGYNRTDSNTKEKHVGARWMKNDETWEEEDVSDASVAEMFCAYYYDLMSSFPEYAGSSIHIFGHSYGGQMSLAATSLLTTAYKCGVLPAYMLPDMVTMLDPFMARAVVKEINWLGEDTPADGNICEVAYQTALDCQKLGITVRLLRANKSVAYPATLVNAGLDFNLSYWNFINNIVYAHFDHEAEVFFGALDRLHNYGWDWFTSYYNGTVLKDAMATKTEEQALCFGMDYDVSFARTGVKYNIDIKNTYDSNDDELSSFYRTYSAAEDDVEYKLNDVGGNESLEEIAELSGKAKIAGFAFFDRNGDGKLNERVQDHLSGATVIVKNADGEVILKTTTGVNGYYQVEVDAEGEYTVSIELPKGYVLSEGTESEVDITILDASYQLSVNNFGAVLK